MKVDADTLITMSLRSYGGHAINRELVSVFNRLQLKNMSTHRECNELNSFETVYSLRKLDSFFFIFVKY